jgi:LysR family nitrogen assimilation transcriptional regulator
MSIDLTRLRYFSTIAQRRSLRRAAEDLHIAQPALSRHVRLLEQELGVKLLTRTARGVTPTEGGLALLRASEKLLDQFGRLKAEVTSIASTPTGTVRIGVLPAFGVRFLAGVVAELRETYAQLTFEITEGFSQRLQDLVLSNQIDMAVLAGLGPHPDLTCTPLYTEEVWLIGSVRYWEAPQKAVDPAYLARHPLIMSQYFKPVAERATGRNKLHVAVQVDGANTIRELIKRGTSLYLGPPTFLWDELTAGAFTGAPVKGLTFQRELVRRKDRPETAAGMLLVQRFIDELQRFARSSGSPITLTTTKRWNRLAKV